MSLRCCFGGQRGFERLSAVRPPMSFCQRDGLGCAYICLALTRPSPKSRNDVEDLDVPDIENDPPALSYEPSDRAAESTFTSSFRLDSISYNMGKLDEALFAICNHRSVSVRVMLTLKDKIYKRQIVGLRNLCNARIIGGGVISLVKI